jgi:hypothetical protein
VFCRGAHGPHRSGVDGVPPGNRHSDELNCSAVLLVSMPSLVVHRQAVNTAPSHRPRCGVEHLNTVMAATPRPGQPESEVVVYSLHPSKRDQCRKLIPVHNVMPRKGLALADSLTEGDVARRRLRLGRWPDTGVVRRAVDQSVEITVESSHFRSRGGRTRGDAGWRGGGSGRGHFADETRDCREDR